jgi:hypothetical protein
VSTRAIRGSREPLEQAVFTLVHRPKASSRASLRTPAIPPPLDGTGDAENAPSELEHHLWRRARCRERWSLAGQAEVTQDAACNERVGDQRDQPAPSATVLAGQYVNPEDPAHELRPGVAARVGRVRDGRAGRWRGGCRSEWSVPHRFHTPGLDSEGHRRRHDHVAPG